MLIFNKKLLTGYWVVFTKNFRGILVIGERNIFVSLSQIIGIAEQANIIMKVMLENTSNERVITENMHKIHALENHSDEVAFKLSQDITAGAVSPNIIDNLIQCVH